MLLLKNGDFDIWYSPAIFHQNFTFQVYAVPFKWRLLIYTRKNLWHRVLEDNKKQVPLKSYSLEIRINSINQILKNKEKVQSTCTISMLTRIKIHVYQIKNWGPGPYNSLCHADNRKYFLGLSLTQNRREAHMFYLVKEEGKIWTCSCWEKVTL